MNIFFLSDQERTLFMLPVIILGAIGLILLYFSPILLMLVFNIFQENENIQEMKKLGNFHKYIIFFIIFYIIMSKLKTIFFLSHHSFVIEIKCELKRTCFSTFQLLSQHTYGLLNIPFTNISRAPFKNGNDLNKVFIIKKFHSNKKFKQCTLWRNFMKFMHRSAEHCQFYILNVNINRKIFNYFYI